MITPNKYHGSLGDNIKVHFAGSEQIAFSLTAHEAGVNYFLFTVFPFICESIGIKGFPITTKNLFPPAELQAMGKHVIMDSGLFTLMFGAKKGDRDEPFLQRWKDLLVDFVNDNKITATCVEIDCQKVLGVKQAWNFRKQLRRDLPNNRIINVFHYEDGKDGLDSLIDFSEYIAISVPELRIIKPKTYREDTYRLANYIKDKKPEIDIHLLGCTEIGMLQRLKFCTTSDSTSWQAVNRYGRIYGKYHPSQIKEEYRKEAYPHIQEVFRRCLIEETPKRVEYYSNYYLAAKIHKMQYEIACGSQD